MPSVTGVQTRDTHKERKAVLKGDALMAAGDDVLLIEIPTEDQPPAGRTTQVRWQVRIVEKPA